MELDEFELATLYTLLQNEINYTEDNFEKGFDEPYLKMLKKLFTKIRNQAMRK